MWSLVCVSRFARERNQYLTHTLLENLKAKIFREHHEVRFQKSKNSPIYGNFNNPDKLKLKLLSIHKLWTLSCFLISFFVFMYFSSLSQWNRKLSICVKLDVFSKMPITIMKLCKKKILNRKLCKMMIPHTKIPTKFLDPSGKQIFRHHFRLVDGKFRANPLTPATVFYLF